MVKSVPEKNSIATNYTIKLDSWLFKLNPKEANRLPFGLSLTWATGCVNRGSFKIEPLSDLSSDSGGGVFLRD